MSGIFRPGFFSCSMFTNCNPVSVEDILSTLHTRIWWGNKGRNCIFVFKQEHTNCLRKGKLWFGGNILERNHNIVLYKKA